MTAKLPRTSSMPSRKPFLGLLFAVLILDQSHILLPNRSSSELDISTTRIGICEVEQPTTPQPADPMVEHVVSMYRIDHALARQIVESVRTAGTANNIDPWLILAFIKVESDGRPQAVSKSGALGLMQLLPSTGQEVSFKLNEEWTGPEQLFDVDTNIRYGTHYLRQLFDRFDSMQAAIAAYNWGPNHIARRIKRNAKLPSEYPIKVLAALPTEGAR